MFLIQTKIEPSELDLLYCLAEANGANIQTSIEQADVIITSISMRKRLERHIDWSLAKQKAVVTPSWVTDSIAKKRRLSCEDYAAVCALENCTKQNCPDHSPTMRSEERSSTPSPISLRLSYVTRFAVQRASPLVCPNQDLIGQLAIIRNARNMDGEERSAMSYSRCIGIIKSYPLVIKSTKQVNHLPFIGPKIRNMIGEYLAKGRIESTSISNTPRYQSLISFMSIHGIGSLTARRLYAAGCRTLEDLDRYYGAEIGGTEEDKSVPESEISGIRAALELRDELSVPISRNEVETIDSIIAEQLEELQPGCLRMIVGGYRRGKESSNDVDIVYTHPESGKEQNLCRKLVERLRQQGLATHVLHLSTPRSTNPLRVPGPSRADRPHWDTLDKSLVIFRLPITDTSGRKSLHRRVDLIFTPIEIYWTAVVGWTGSTLFERDLRLWAKQKMGMKFDSSGITRRRDTKQFFPDSEHAVFELLGLEFIDPVFRNADP